MTWVELFAFKKALAPVIISYYCCLWSLIGRWPWESLLSGRAKGQAQARAPGTGSMCRGGAPISNWAFERAAEEE